VPALGVGTGIVGFNVPLEMVQIISLMIYLTGANNGLPNHSLGWWEWIQI